jgi:hypothetical protein
MLLSFDGTRGQDGVTRQVPDETVSHYFLEWQEGVTINKSFWSHASFDVGES